MDPNNNNTLMAFWAPFLLSHLGGPDNIMAYSLEDNELWSFQCLWLELSSMERGPGFSDMQARITSEIIWFYLPLLLLLLQGCMRTAPSMIKLTSYSTTNSCICMQTSSSAWLTKKTSEGIIKSMSAEDAFQVVEMELNFMYDVLYTKATVVYTPLGILLRCISFFSTVSTLVAFCFFFIH